MANMVNILPGVPKSKKVDMDLAKAVAALHDIGNCISRSGHSHYGYGIVTGNLSPEEIKIIAEAVQDHNVDYHIPEKADKLDKYEARSPYGMIVADADKTADPVSELIRQIKYGLEKLVPEGKESLVSTYHGEIINEKGATEDKAFPISAHKNGRETYIADMTAMLDNCQEQTHKRYDTLVGTDSYMQLDAKYGFNIGSRMYSQIHRIADSIENTRANNFRNCYEIALGYLTAYGFDSSKAIMAREAEVYKDFNPENGDFFSWSLDFSPKSLSLEKDYPIQMPAGIHERMDTLAQIDNELSRSGILVELYQQLEDKDAPAKEVKEIAAIQKEIRVELFRLQECRSRIQRGEHVDKTELVPNEKIVSKCREKIRQEHSAGIDAR